MQMQNSVIDRKLAFRQKMDFKLNFQDIERN